MPLMFNVIVLIDSSIISAVKGAKNSILQVGGFLKDFFWCKYVLKMIIYVHQN